MSSSFKSCPRCRRSAFYIYVFLYIFIFIFFSASYSFFIVAACFFLSFTLIGNFFLIFTTGAARLASFGVPSTIERLQLSSRGCSSLPSSSSKVIQEEDRHRCAWTRWWICVLLAIITGMLPLPLYSFSFPSPFPLRSLFLPSLFPLPLPSLSLPPLPPLLLFFFVYYFFPATQQRAPTKGGEATRVRKTKKSTQRDATQKFGETNGSASGGKGGE